MQYFAQIKDNQIKNIIVANEETQLSHFAENFNYLIEVNREPGSPGVGWLFNPVDHSFQSPPQPEASVSEESEPWWKFW